MDKIIELSLPKEARVIVISDIHGELDLFKRLLDKVNYSQDDYLILNGDLCEKGPDSSGVVQYIMALSEKSTHVWVTEGNCDTIVEDLIEENPDLIPYLHRRPKSLLNEWLKELGYTLNDKSHIQEINGHLFPRYKKEIEWLQNLPTAIQTEDYVFVHAGLEDREDWRETDRGMALTFSAFLNHAHQAKQYVVVGHWPVINYPMDTPSHNPIINHEKRILATDGGNVVKTNGQLNAFIISRGGPQDQFSFVSVDRFSEREARADFQADLKWVGHINWKNYEVTPVERGEYFTVCEQEGQLFYVKNEYLLEKDSGQSFVKADVSCAQLNVKKGDLISILDDSCSGFQLIKKEGLEGWVPKTV